MANLPQLTIVYDPQTIVPIIAYHGFEKRTFTIEQYLHVRDELREHIQIYTNHTIPDTTHARLIVKNLPEIYKITIKNLKFISTTRVKMLAELIEQNKTEQAIHLIEYFNIIREFVNWPRNI
jgi:hypothetical protein